jgi:hypothetical protein
LEGSDGLYYQAVAKNRELYPVSKRPWPLLFSVALLQHHLSDVSLRPT